MGGGSNVQPVQQHPPAYSSYFARRFVLLVRPGSTWFDTGSIHERRTSKNNSRNDVVRLCCKGLREYLRRSPCHVSMCLSQAAQPQEPVSYRRVVGWLTAAKKIYFQKSSHNRYPGSLSINCARPAVTSAVVCCVPGRVVICRNTLYHTLPRLHRLMRNPDR